MSRDFDARLGEALARAGTLATDLGFAADALNSAIVKVEQAISSLKLGVRGSVILDSNDDPRDGWYRALVFGKEAKAWRLLVETGDEIHDHIDEVVPLVNASRDVRLRAVGKLPELVEVLVERASEELKTVAECAADAERLAETLRLASKGGTP